MAILELEHVSSRAYSSTQHNCPAYSSKSTVRKYYWIWTTSHSNKCPSLMYNNNIHSFGGSNMAIFALRMIFLDANVVPGKKVEVFDPVLSNVPLGSLSSITPLSPVLPISSRSPVKFLLASPVWSARGVWLVKAPMP